MIKDISNQTFGMLTAVRPTNNRRYNSVVWELKCICGRLVYRTLRSLNNSISHNHVISCGCGRSSRVDYSYLIDQKFGKLLVVDVYRKYPSIITCKCICNCGSECDVTPYQLIHEVRSSCSHRCRTYRPKLDPGVSNAHQIYNLYLNYAKRNKIPFSITVDQFMHLTQQPCAICNQLPTVKWHSVENQGRNGAYYHNKIAYIDRDIGYDIDNVVTVCLEHIKQYRVDHRI